MVQPPKVRFERELRLAIVMYGGVSLAIYMNGVSQELLHLVRSTAADPDADPKDPRALLPGNRLTGSERVYRKLARLGIGDDASGGNDAEPVLRQRFVIDILSGTSAGGINAIFLAKALANGQSIEGLARLWQDEGDIELLINDAESRRGVENLPKNQKPRSLLNSDRMYRKLLDAFDQMDDGSRESTGHPLVDDVELYVTTTDLLGLPVRLQLGGGEVAEEKRYRKRFHLTRKGDRNDFEHEDNPFLAFVARCTSSFPVAFEPMRFDTAVSLLKRIGRWLPAVATSSGREGIPVRWQRHFDEYVDPAEGGASPRVRPFADGGYLDNKPFGYAIDAIASRRGGDSGRVERKLIYIEPDPERFPAAQAFEGTDAPNAVQNALSVGRLRGYETIREELLRLRDRNRLVDRIRSVVAGVDADFEALGDAARGNLAAIIANRDQFGDRALDKVVAVFGSAYGGYHRLKVGQLTDDLAQLVAAHAGIPSSSDESRAFRLMVRGWRNARYTPNPTAVEGSPEGTGRAMKSEFQLLEAFDLSYRVRRASFVIEQINRLGVLQPGELAKVMGSHPSICGGPTAAAIAAEVPSDLADAFDTLRRDLAGVVRDLRSARDALVSPEPAQVLPEIAQHADAMREAAATIMSQPTVRQRWAVVDNLVKVGGDIDRMLVAIQKSVEDKVEEATRVARERCWKLLKTDDGKPRRERAVPAEAADVARFIARHYYTWYELYDSMLFPITHGSEVGEEIAPVEPVRISPLTGRDGAGRSIANPKLMPAGVAVGHFGGFLSADWRARDILLGRLNAAEKMIRTVLAGTSHDQPEVAAALIEEAQVAILEEECSRPGSIMGRRLASVQNLTETKDRLSYLRTEGIPPEELPPTNVVTWIARSSRVMGRVFREVSDRSGVQRIASGLYYGGQILTGMVEVLVPRRWWWQVFRLWIPRLLVFAVVLIVLGALLGKEQVTGLGWSVLWMVSGFVALTVLLRSWIAGRGSWALRTVASLVALAVVTLVTIGIVYAPDAVRALRQHLIGEGSP